MSEIRSVFVPRDPSIVGQVKDWHRERHDWLNACAQRVHDALPGRSLVTREGFDGTEFVGASSDWNERTADVPALWRRIEPRRGQPYLVPRRKTTAERELHKSLMVPPFPEFKLAGMPDRWWGDRAVTATGGVIVHSCNWRMFGDADDPDQLFVVWSCEVPFTADQDARPGPDDTDGMGSKGADPVLWERIPLSVFYAAKEADDARKAAVSV